SGTLSGMPAVTADTLTLPRIVHLPDSETRPVKLISDAPSGFEGEGFPVRRAFAGISDADLDPFIHMDQMGEVNYAPYEPRGTDWHPHRGFETVTYIIDGMFLHQDSHGGGGSITNGATQWMTAGSGVLHIETPPESLVVTGGLFHGLQLWVNLPSSKKMTEPRYQNLEPTDVVLATSHDAGSIIRIIAGDIDGHRGPGGTHTPITICHVTVSAGHEVVVPWNPAYNALAYTLSGAGSAGAEQVPMQTGRIAVFGAGDSLTFTASETQDLDLYVLGGEPIREPVAKYGPFVMNNRAELQQAFEDFQAGRLGTVPADGLRPFRG
ncbi:MAG: pirin family protein, partial [Acidimicrobiaceae bacterium]